MAFGITRDELQQWKLAVLRGDIVCLTHYWEDDRFPNCTTVTKVGCVDVDKLKEWGKQYGLQPEWIDPHETYPHFDLFGHIQFNVLEAEGEVDQIRRFNLKK